MKRKYLIRYNTMSVGEHEAWRVIDGDHEILVSNVVIETMAWTSQDSMEGIGIKHHISCIGLLEIVDNIAYIK